MGRKEIIIIVKIIIFYQWTKQVFEGEVVGWSS